MGTSRRMGDTAWLVPDEELHRPLLLGNAAVLTSTLAFPPVAHWAGAHCSRKPAGAPESLGGDFYRQATCLKCFANGWFRDKSSAWSATPLGSASLVQELVLNEFHAPVHVEHIGVVLGGADPDFELRFLCRIASNKNRPMPKMRARASSRPMSSSGESTGTTI